jgi:hypothetical protein
VTSRSKIRDLEIRVRESEAGGLALKQAMREATDSEYAVSQKLAYETAARRGLEAEFEVVLKSLENDQTTIAGYEVELNDLKGAANYAMSRIPVPEGEQQQSNVDRLVDTPNRLLTLLRATGLAAVTDALRELSLTILRSTWPRLREVPVGHTPQVLIQGRMKTDSY